MTQLMTKEYETSPVSRTDLDVQITTARCFPRNIENSINEAMTMATIDDEIAQSCFYCLFRKGKDGERVEIKGPSIRLAEIFASSWGNLHVATRISENDGKTITAEAYCWDLEKNLRAGNQVKRSIITSKGNTYSQDMQVTTGNAAASIALRNAIFKVIPKPFIDKVYKQAIKFAIGDQKTFNAKRKSVFDRFRAMGIEEEKICLFFNKTSLEQFDVKDIENLIGIGTAIKEGTLKIEDAFVIEEKEARTKADLLAASIN
jgi:hypothetical protein